MNQTTWIYCPRCKHEMIGCGQDFLSDTDLVRYRCHRCGHVSAWLFDAPTPILVEGILA